MGRLSNKMGEQAIDVGRKTSIEQHPIFESDFGTQNRTLFCRATDNSTHLLISTPLNDCGTLVNETEDSLIFWNEIRVGAVIIDNVITRTHDIKFPFSCRYSRREVLSLSFTPRSIIIGHEGKLTIRTHYCLFCFKFFVSLLI